MRKSTLMLAGVWILCSSVVLADSAGDLAAIVTKGKQATALVEIKSRSGETVYGSAFCISTNGLFVTNNHVTESAGGKEIKLILNPNEETQKILTGKVLRCDPGKDLALVQVKVEGPLPALTLGSIDDLVETAELVSFGYPFGTMLANKGAYPDITVSTSKVTSLRKADGKLTHIQIDGSLNPGNSGGPVMDKNGKVVGVVESGVLGASVCLAIPASVVTEFLAKPELAFDAPEVTDATAALPARFEARLTSPLHPASDYALSIELSVGGRTRRFEMPLVGDKNVAVVAPLPPKTGPDEVHVAAVFERGTLEGYVVDWNFTCGGKAYKFSEIASMKGNPLQVTMRDQTILTDPPAQLGATELLLGESRVKVDLTKAQKVLVTLPPADSVVEYKIVATYKGEVANTLSGALKVRRTVAAAAAGAADAPAAGAVVLSPTEVRDVIEKKLPDTVQSAVLAGNGRFIIMHMPKTRKFAVLDVITGEIIRYLSVDDDNVRFAGGATKLVVALIDKNVLLRYDLTTFEKELTVPLPPMSIKSMAMGCSSMGPAICHGVDGLQLLDLRTLTMSKLETEGNFGIHEYCGMHVAADGSAFGSYNLNVSPSGVTFARFRGKKARGTYNHNSEGVVIPSADGSVVFTSAGIFTPDLKPLSSGGPGPSTPALMPVPACSGNYYLGIPPWNPSPPRRSQDTKPQGPPNIQVYMIGESRPLYSFPMPSIVGSSNCRRTPSGGMDIADRIYFIPGAQIIAFISDSGDRVVLKQFSLIDALKNSEFDYFIVTSTPPKVAHPGQMYEYAMTVLSKQGGVKYLVDSGPDGMRISPDGRITWLVPASLAGKETCVITRVTNAAGQETYHTFTVTVEGD